MERRPRMRMHTPSVRTLLYAALWSMVLQCGTTRFLSLSSVTSVRRGQRSSNATSMQCRQKRIRMRPAHARYRTVIPKTPSPTPSYMYMYSPLPWPLRLSQLSAYSRLYAVSTGSPIIPISPVDPPPGTTPYGRNSHFPSPGPAPNRLLYLGRGGRGPGYVLCAHTFTRV